MASRKRREVPEEHENHERWMVTYADMVTLLMVLFIVMFSMSQVDERKYNALKESLSAGFGRSSVVMDGSESLLTHAGSSPVQSLTPQQYRDLSPEERQVVEAEVTRQQMLRTQRAYAEAKAEVERLLDLKERLQKALEQEGLTDDVVTTIDRRGLVLSLVSRHVVFAADRAELTDRGRKAVATLSRVLRRIPDPLEIDGHTNQVPVKPKYYATDWDLSSARAITVLRYLNEQQGIAGERLTASAFGHEKPLVDPREKGSQRVNKRVDIIVLSDLPAESRELLEQAAEERGDRT